MGFLRNLFMGSAARRRATAKPAAPEAIEEQRRQLEKQVMTPERQELIAQAMAVRQSKQALLKELETSVGAERMAEALRRMMNDGR